RYNVCHKKRAHVLLCHRIIYFLQIFCQSLVLCYYMIPDSLELHGDKSEKVKPSFILCRGIFLHISS
ncbi:hypothetical protein PFDG_04982, partial [Plasmodium falciparum Dd2]